MHEPTSLEEMIQDKINQKPIRPEAAAATKAEAEAAGPAEAEATTNPTLSEQDLIVWTNSLRDAINSHNKFAVQVIIKRFKDHKPTLNKMLSFTDDTGRSCFHLACRVHTVAKVTTNSNPAKDIQAILKLLLDQVDPNDLMLTQQDKGKPSQVIGKRNDEDIGEPRRTPSEWAKQPPYVNKASNSKYQHTNIGRDMSILADMIQDKINQAPISPEAAAATKAEAEAAAAEAEAAAAEAAAATKAEAEAAAAEAEAAAAEAEAAAAAMEVTHLQYNNDIGVSANKKILWGQTIDFLSKNELNHVNATSFIDKVLTNEIVKKSSLRLIGNNYEGELHKSLTQLRGKIANHKSAEETTNTSPIEYKGITATVNVDSTSGKITAEKSLEPSSVHSGIASFFGRGNKKEGARNQPDVEMKDPSTFSNN